MFASAADARLQDGAADPEQANAAALIQGLHDQTGDIALSASKRMDWARELAVQGAAGQNTLNYDIRVLARRLQPRSEIAAEAAPRA